MTSPDSVEAEKPSDLTRDCDHVHVLLGVEGLPQEEAIQNFVEEELSGVELGRLLGGDEVVQDVCWSDATTTSSSFTSQPPTMPLMQQELEYSMAMPFAEGSQFPITSTMNSIHDGWSWGPFPSFDLSTLEPFSSTP